MTRFDMESRDLFNRTPPIPEKSRFVACFLFSVDFQPELGGGGAACKLEGCNYVPPYHPQKWRRASAASTRGGEDRKGLVKPSAKQPASRTPRNPWMSIEICGVQIISIDFYANQWTSIDSLGNPWISTNANQWISIDFHEYQWIHGYP